MKQKKCIFDGIIDRHRLILSFAALFECDFNIDWLQELTCEKASQVFSVLEFGLQKNWLAKKKQDFLCFVNNELKLDLREMLSPEEKKSIYRNIVTILFRELSNPSDQIEIIAPHLLFIDNDLEGCQLLIKGGNIHRMSYRYEEARRYYEKAMKDLRVLGGEQAELLFIDTALQYSKVSTSDPDSNRAILAIGEAMRLAKLRNFESSLALLELHMAKSEWLLANHHAALVHFEKGYALARATEDPKIQKTAANFSVHFNFWMGRFQDVIHSYEMIAPDIEHFPEEGTSAMAVISAGYCASFCGHPTQGLGLMHAVRTYYQKIGNIYIAGHAGTTIGAILMELHRVREAKKYLEEAMKETRASHNLYSYIVGLACLSYVCYLMNDREQAFSLVSEFFELSNRAHMNIRDGIVIMSLGWAVEEGKFPRCEGLDLEDEIRRSLQGGNELTRGIAYRYRAMLSKRRGIQGGDILIDLERSINCLEKSGHQIELAKSRVELVREYLRLGHEGKAMALLEPAVQTLRFYNDALVPDDIRSLVENLRSGENLLEEILRLGRELVSIRDMRDLFRRIISSVNRITGAERGAIFLASDQNCDGFTLRAAKNLTAEDVALPEFKDSMQLIEETFKSGNGRIINLEESDHAVSQENGDILSRICVPMIIRERVAGVLYNDNRLFRSVFKESDLEILNYFAAQAAIAMDNAQAWQALQDMYDKEQREKNYFEKQYLENIHFEDFVGKSLGIVKVFSQVDQVADTDATVLILGETGVGKELVARSIHRHSPRHDRPFIRVHCSALSESLISSELFGHEKGAFTGATTRQIGRFELANGGTLFLDEIGEISMETQVKLLRVLQNGEFERVGGHETLRSDFRLLAATNRDLRKEVQSGRFRQDLYYRLNVFPIHVPPLRERKEDIALLVQYFLEIFATKFNMPVERVLQREMEKLLAYDWPGNVRELQNVIERAVILSRGKNFRIPELGDRQTLMFAATTNTLISMKEMERNHILNILKKTRGKITGAGGAAEILEIHPNTLFSRMKKLGIQRNPNL